MDAHVLEQARRRIDDARGAGTSTSRFEAALERSRAEVESLARATAELEESLPDRVSAAMREGLAQEVVPVARSLAEIRGLLNQAIRRLERLEQELLAERSARIEDLAVLVELVSSGWQGVDVRLQRLEDGVGGNVVPLRAEAAAAIA
jgi:ABC-type transporter Mla subunit MlaD